MLTDTHCRNAHRHDKTDIRKAFSLYDSKGLFLLVKPSPKLGWLKWWRFRYRRQGKSKTLSFGTYPAVSLEEARSKRDDALRLLAQGVDPSRQRRADKAAAGNTLNSVCKEYVKKKNNDSNENRVKLQLNYILPDLGDTPIDTIRPIELLKCLRRAEKSSGVYSAKKALQKYGQIWRYAVASGKAEIDITASLKDALGKHEKKHFAAVTEPKDFAEVLRAADRYQGSFLTVCALKISIYAFQRPGEIRAAKWQDFDLEAKEWRYLVTKTNTQHIVPLSRQVMALLDKLKPLTGGGYWLFPSEKNPNNTQQGRNNGKDKLQGRCLSENTVNDALKSLGFKGKQTAHGLRAVGRTMLDEQLLFRPDFVEQQLAHVVRDPLGRAYNRTKHMSQRVAMMQAWADYLDALKAETSNVVAIGRARAGQPSKYKEIR